MLYPGSPVKSLIIEYVAHVSFCAPKEILISVNSCLKKAITHQALYKNLKSLLAENVLVKHGHNYTFTTSFLSRMEAFSGSLREDVSILHDLNDIVKSIDKRGSLSFTFQSMYQNQKFYNSFVSSLFYCHGVKDDMCRLMHHYGGIFFEREKDFLSQVAANGSIHDYFIGETEFDAHTYKVAKDINTSFKWVKNLQKEELSTEYVVSGPYILCQQYQPPDTARYTAFLESFDCDNFSNSEFYYYYKYQHLPSTVTVEKNFEKAEKLRKKIESLPCV